VTDVRLFTLGDPTCWWPTDRQHTGPWLVALITVVVGDTVTTAADRRVDGVPGSRSGILMCVGPLLGAHTP